MSFILLLKLFCSEEKKTKMSFELPDSAPATFTPPKESLEFEEESDEDSPTLPLPDPDSDEESDGESQELASQPVQDTSLRRSSRQRRPTQRLVLHDDDETYGYSTYNDGEYDECFEGSDYEDLLAREEASEEVDDEFELTEEEEDEEADEELLTEDELDLDNDCYSDEEMNADQETFEYLNRTCRECSDTEEEQSE